MNLRVRRLIGSTVGLIPITVRRGYAKGARWTLFPWTSYWRGTHEEAIQAAFAHLGDGNIGGWSCWDLGAHYGLYSIALSLRTGPEGQVAAFEPNPESFSRLERHRRMNRLAWLKTYQAAASNVSGSNQLLTYGDLGSTSTHLCYPDEKVTQDSAPITIRTLRLDDEVASGRLRPPQFVKVDVEGHGHKAFEGMQATLARARPTMIVGFHSAEEVEGVMAILNPLKYRCRAIVTPPSNPESLIGGDYLFSP